MNVMPTIVASRLSQVMRRFAAATPGPWRVMSPQETTGWGLCVGQGSPREGKGEIVARITGHHRNRYRNANAEFIANSYDDIAWMISEITRLSSCPKEVSCLAAEHADASKQDPVSGEPAGNRIQSLLELHDHGRLSTRAANTLMLLGADTTEDAAKLGYIDLIRQKGCGPVTANEIARMLQAHGLELKKRKDNDPK